jgi:hypothetical protein
MVDWSSTRFFSTATIRIRKPRKAAIRVADTGSAMSTAASRTASHAMSTIVRSPSSTPPNPCHPLNSPREPTL